MTLAFYNDMYVMNMEKPRLKEKESHDLQTSKESCIERPKSLSHLGVEQIKKKKKKREQHIKSSLLTT